MVPLMTEAYYHIYNHANGKENLFVEEDNYRYFLGRYEKYVVPVVHTLAYCLMPNHFHFMVQIKSETQIINYLNRSPAAKRFTSLQTPAEREAFVSSFVSKQFANLFSSYTQGFNKTYKRMGSMFVKNFKRKRIEGEDYFTNLLLYIHLNPVKHGFEEKPGDWEFSSYNTMLSRKKTFLLRETVLDWFDGIENFRSAHAEDKLFQSSELWKSWESELE